jgi:predicted nucleotidyltransferase
MEKVSDGKDVRVTLRIGLVGERAIHSDPLSPFAVRRTETACSLFTDPAALKSVCRRHHIRQLSLFGSTLKGTDRPDSDVDLLVEFEPGSTPGLIRLAGIAMELSELLGGRQVDLRTAGDLSRYFRDEVVRTAEVQYAA